MSLWNRALQLPPEAVKQVHSIYGEMFPIEVRHYLAQFIEDNMINWNEIDLENPTHVIFAQEVLNSIIQEIQNKCESYSSQETMFLVRLKLQEAANLFRMKYCNNPMGLVSVIRNCLNTELQLIQQHETLGGNMVQTGVVQVDPAVEIAQQLDMLRRRTSDTGNDLKQLDQELEAFELQYYECTKINAHLTHLQRSRAQGVQPSQEERALLERKISMEEELRVKLSSLLQKRMALADKHKDTIESIGLLQRRVLDEELIKWKKAQQMAGNGKHFNPSKLDQIQEWCEALADVIWMNRHQIKECERHQNKYKQPHGTVDLLPMLNQHITTMLSSLVTSTFIIEKEPPQVMKTNTRFAATVRLLVGGQLNVYMTPPQVKVSIISEAQAHSLLKTEQPMGKNEQSGDILNNTGTMEYNQQTRQLSVNFRNMQLHKIKRAEKKGTESVMDEKFALLFQSQFSVGGGELVFQVWTLSLPVVVIVHGNQEPHAWATVSWDNAFSDQGRVPFVVPDKVPWPQVADMLDTKFKADTGRGLTENHLQFLAGKAFRNPNITDFSKMMLSWSQFCKEPLPDRNFTFWEWFFAVKKVTREHLRHLWNDGAIMGFVGRKYAEDLLKSSASGTFLLRFSDSELGGVTIAWMYIDAAKGTEKDVFMLQPFTSKDFAIRPLADRISDLQYLQYLYPDKSKDNVFGKYYTQVNDSGPSVGTGYVRSTLINVIPGFPAAQPDNQFSYQNDMYTVNSPGNEQMQAYQDLVEEFIPDAAPQYDLASLLMDDIGDMIADMSFPNQQTMNPN